jgi:chromosome segregation ATPase
MDIREIEKITRDYEAKKKEIAALTEEVTNLSNEKISLLNEMTGLRDVRTKDSEISKAIKAEIKELTAVRNNLSNEIAKAKASAEKIQRDIDKDKRSVHEEREDILKEWDLIKGKTKELEARKKSLDDFEEMLKKERVKLSSMIKDVSSDKREIEKTLSDSREKNRILLELSDEARTQGDRMKRELSDVIRLKDDLEVSEKILADRTRRLDDRAVVLERKEAVLQEKEIDLDTKEKQLESEKRSLKNVMSSLEVEKKKLKITQLRIDEIIRLNGIDKELKALEENVR